ncbi:lysophospholipase L1-like esterase [Pseudomonas sp. TE3786]
MVETLIKIALAPLLLLQGLYVRRVTPKLPEPVGERSGVIGSGPHMRLLVLGDSAAAGVGVASQAEALSGQLLANLALDYRVSWRLLAQSGFGIAQVLAMIERTATEPFDAVLVSVGVNDVTGGLSSHEWGMSISRLLDQLLWKYGVPQVLLAPVPPMHAFPALPQPLRWYLGRRARQFNQVLAQLASSRVDCQLQAGDFPLQGDSLAADGFHPGAATYTIWANDTAATLRRCFADPISLGGRLVETPYSPTLS